MTPRNFATYVRQQTGTNSTTFTDAKILSYMNLIKDDYAARIAECNEDIFGMILYRNLVRGQREYSFPEKVLNNIKYAEVDEMVYNRSAEFEDQLQQLYATCPQTTIPMLPSSGKYKRLNELDINTTHSDTDETGIRKYMSGRPPSFDIFRNSYWVWSDKEIPPIRDGLKVYIIQYPDNYETLNSDVDLANDLVRPLSSGLPRQVHTIWADAVIVMFKNSKDKPIPLTDAESKIEDRLKVALAEITGTNLDRTQTSSVPQYAEGQNF